MRKLVLWWRLPPSDRREILRAWTMLWGAELGLRATSLKQTQRWLRRLAPTVAPADAPGIDRVVRWVDVAARHHLLKITCLRRALVLMALLERWGRHPELRLGVRRDGISLAAHAWVEVEGQVVGEASDPQANFAPLQPTGGWG